MTINCCNTHIGKFFLDENIGVYKFNVSIRIISPYGKVFEENLIGALDLASLKTSKDEHIYSLVSHLLKDFFEKIKKENINRAFASSIGNHLFCAIRSALSREVEND